MIGIVVTGHGEFALGLASAAEMIFGELKKIHTAPFLATDTSESLKKKIQTEIGALRKETDQILILADLVGGTPFNVAMEVSQHDDQIDVIGGVNLPILIEAAMLREMNDDLAELTNNSLRNGKLGIQTIRLEAVNENNEHMLDSGI